MIDPTIVEERDYQIRIKENVLKAVDEGHKSILIVAPTGSGKTIIGHQVIEELYKRPEYNSYGWCCHRVGLVKQAAYENNKKFMLDDGYYFSAFSDNPPMTDILLEDEAQHSASATSTALFGKVNPSLYLSLTATPYRTDRMKLCFSKIIHDAGLRQLVDAGYLSPYKLFIYDDYWTPEWVSRIYLNDPDRWGRTVIFFPRLEDCYRCKDLITSAGIGAQVAHGGDPFGQEVGIEALRNGDIRVLLNVFVLTEGFDMPELETVFVRPSKKGPTIQMAGRAFRKYPGLPFKNIVQSGKSHTIFSDVVSPLDTLLWDKNLNNWESYKEDYDKINTIRGNALFAISHSPEPKLPKFLTKNKPWFRRHEDQ